MSYNRYCSGAIATLLFVLTFDSSRSNVVINCGGMCKCHYIGTCIATLYFSIEWFKDVLK